MNGDRIRQMSDEELVAVLGIYGTNANVLAWLKQETEAENNPAAGSGAIHRRETAYKGARAADAIQS